MLMLCGHGSRLDVTGWGERESRSIERCFAVDNGVKESHQPSLFGDLIVGDRLRLPQPISRRKVIEREFVRSSESSRACSLLLLSLRRLSLFFFSHPSRAIHCRVSWLSLSPSEYTPTRTAPRPPRYYVSEN